MSLMDGEGAGGAGADAGVRRTSETLMSSRMFRMRFARGCRRCPRSFPKGAVNSVARQLGHLGFSYLRSEFRTSPARSRGGSSARTRGVSRRRPPQGQGVAVAQGRACTCLVRRRGSASRSTPWLPHLPRPETRFPALGRATLSAPSTVPTASRLLCRDAFSRASGERGALNARPRESSTDVASRPRCRPSTRPRVAVRG